VIRTTSTTKGDDQITTRLFHLEGLEPGLNQGSDCDSYSRGIMIHGTPDEGLIGTPASHGCVRMKNEDVLQLFEMINHGTYVVILNN
jgi:lipoprotein-anchoring transpeptidase ErfK/SrfK